MSTAWVDTPWKGYTSFTQKQKLNAMRKPIYFNEERMDLLWLPQYGKVVGEVANELYSEGMHFDNEIRKQDEYLRSAFINNTTYKAWSCNKPSALRLLSHSKIQEINAMTQIRTIPTKEQVLEAAKRCPQAKAALEILFPEDFISPSLTGILLLNVDPKHRQKHVYVSKETKGTCWRVTDDLFGTQQVLRSIGIIDVENWYGKWLTNEEAKELF